MLKRLCLFLVALSLPGLLGQRTGAVSAATGDALPTASFPLPTTAGGFEGLPDLDSAAASPRFLTVSGSNNFTIPGDGTGVARNQIRLTFTPAVGTDRIRVAVYDADAKGHWDQQFDGVFVLQAPETDFEVFPDPTNGGAAPDTSITNRVAFLKASDVTTDEGWTELLDQPSSSVDMQKGKGADGRFHFLVRTTLKDPAGGTLSGYEINGYKLAYNGTYLLPANNVLGFTGGAIDGLVVFDGSEFAHLITRDPFPNEYSGSFDFRFDPSNFCSDLQVYNGDADWNRDLTAQEIYDPSPTGAPPDNGIKYINPQPPAGARNATDFRVGDAVQYEFVRPNSTVFYASKIDHPNHRPSIDQAQEGQPADVDRPFQKVTLTAAQLKLSPGVWNFHWVGLDAHNSVFIKFNQDFGTTPRVPTANGRLFCDDNGNGTWEQGETVFPGVQVTFTPVGGGAAKNATTDASGVWSLQLAAGSYDVSIPTQPCATARIPLPARLVVDACLGGHLDIPMDCSLSVNGHVFCDNNGNNVFDAGDTALAGSVTVRLEKLNAQQQVTQTINVQTVGANWTATGLSFGTWRAFVPSGQALTDPLTKTSAQPQTFTLDAQNCSKSGIDFGYRCNVPFCLRLFCDPNLNCLFDQGDSALSPVDVTITMLPNGVPITRTTDATGRVCFDVGPGSYTVTIGALPPGYLNATLRFPLAGPVVVTDQAIDLLLCYDCPNPARIHGKVFKENCLNTCDGIIDNDIVPFPGILVSLVGTNPVRPPQVDVTDANGDYSFENLPPGTYAVSIDGGDPVFFGLTETSSTTVPATVLPGDDVMVNFPWCECAKARVYGYVYRNPPCTCDGSYDLGVDAPLEGVRVTLSGAVADGVVFFETFTDAAGLYEFNELQPGTYTVEVDGSSPQVVNLTPGTPTVVGPFELPGGSERRVDFGYCSSKVCGFVNRYPPCTCCGGEDGNGQPLEGVAVHLLQTAGPVVGATWDTFTGADGGYCFLDLGPGTYEVSIPAGQAILDGLTAGGPLVRTVTIDAGECRFDVSFCFMPPPEQKLCAKVFWEPKGFCDGRFDEGRDQWFPWIEVFVALAGDNDGYLASGFTDATGKVCFRDLPPGDYRIYVGGNQPALTGFKPSTPNCYYVHLGPCEEACAPFGWCKTCVPTPCCEGDLHEVLVGTAFWLGDCARDLRLKARLFQGCGCGCDVREIDSLGLNWRSTFPGETRGLNEVLTLVDVKVKNGVAYVVLKVSANGQWFRDGAFGRDPFKLEVTLNGTTYSACATLRCESFRPGMLFTWGRGCPRIPACDNGWHWDGRECWDAPWLKCGWNSDARFLVLDTWSREGWECTKCSTCASTCNNCPRCSEILATRGGAHHDD